MTINLESIKIPRGTEICASRGKIFIKKNRKSRIIMKDGRLILSLAESVLALNPSYKVELSTNAPMCSKTKKFLEENGIAVTGL